MLPLVRQATGLLLLSSIYLACTGAMTALHMPFPGSLVGLLVCAGLIRAGVIPLLWIEGAANTLLRHLPLLYLPLVAAIGQFWPLLKQSGAGLVPLVMVSTGLVLITTGLTAERLGRRTEQPDVDPSR